MAGYTIDPMAADIGYDADTGREDDRGLTGSIRVTDVQLRRFMGDETYERMIARHVRQSEIEQAWLENWCMEVLGKTAEELGR